MARKKASLSNTVAVNNSDSAALPKRKLDALDFVTLREKAPPNSKIINDIAIEDGELVRIKRLKNADFIYRKPKLGDWLFVRDIASVRKGLTLASTSYLQGKIVINSAKFFRPHSNDKSYQQRMFANTELAEWAIPSFAVDTKDEVQDLLNGGRLHFPILIKPEQGAQGNGVQVIKNLSQLDEIGSFSEKVVQPYIDFEREWRAYVIGGVFFAACYSRNTIGSDRKPHGRYFDCETSPEILRKIEKISLLATSILGLEYAGIDILRDKVTGQFYIIEANVAPAVVMEEWCEKTKVNIADEIFHWFKERDKLLLQKLPLETCLSDYLTSRAGKLAKGTRDAVASILALKDVARTDLTEKAILDDYFGTSLEDKLKFLYSELNEQKHPKITKLILDEAGKSVSWAGNFLVNTVPQNDNFTVPSVAHTLGNGAVASAYYIAIKKMMNR
ncbi:MAG: hypothetical protein LBK50_00175 [Candidatus Nomurabacteria bacterium]|jgi:glutathione synthase/RimK-type ligase-like ATP-grasp enzyme|nr:hypothetical protein [Candidatus Nomurabacteria bacterium]